MSFCYQPFYRIEINSSGQVYTCCPFFLNVVLGNIYEQPFDEIWNGENARKIRRTLLQGDLSICSDLCYRKNINKGIETPTDYSEIVEKYPQEIAISTDTTCNVKCIICRDTNTNYSANHRVTPPHAYSSVYLPIFKNAEIVHFGIDGDPFSSKKECSLIKEIAEKYPKVKFNFQSNGIIANENFLKQLNVFDKIDTMTVSIHAATRWTYNKIVKEGNWNKLLSNLSLYSEMKKAGIINNFRLIFVVFSLNYKEMPKFVNFAKKYNAHATFWTLRKNPSTTLGQNFEKYSVINPQHKSYKDLKRILQNPIFNSEDVEIHPNLKALMNN